MVANIRSGSSPGGALYYNKEKVDKGEAEVLFRQKMLEPFDRYGRLDIDACMESFRRYLEANRRTINTVFHTSLNPSPVDELTDEQLRDITREYMERMGYGQQPYIVFKHKDISREHLHIVSLRVDENGRKISDSHEYDRSMSVLRELERKYGLHLAPEKDSVQRERLREPDKTKYEIYDAIKGCLPKCKSWNDLEGRLKEQGINVRYKYCGNTNRKQGVLFSKNDFEFSGSKIDRQFSFSKLNLHFAYAQQQTRHRSAIVKDFHAAAGSYRSAFSDLFGTGGGKTDTDRPTVNFSGNIGELPLPPNSSPVELSEAQLQRKPGESPEEYLARITALLNTIAEAMAIAAMERKRRLRERMTKPKVKL